MIRLDEMIAMDARRNCDRILLRLHELQDRHLSRGILHNHAIDAKREETFAAFEFLRSGFPGVAIHDFLCKGHRPPKLLANDRQIFFEALVHAGREFPRRLDEHCARIRSDFAHRNRFRFDLKWVVDDGEVVGARFCHKNSRWMRYKITNISPYEN